MHWKHAATRCAVEGCEYQRMKGWSTCAQAAHRFLGQSLYGAGRIGPIPAPQAPPVTRCRHCGGVDGCFPGCTDRD